MSGERMPSPPSLVRTRSMICSLVSFVAATTKLNYWVSVAVLRCYPRGLIEKVRDRAQASDAHGAKDVDCAIVDRLQRHHLHFPPRVLTFPGKVADGPVVRIGVTELEALGNLAAEDLGDLIFRPPALGAEALIAAARLVPDDGKLRTFR